MAMLQTKLLSCVLFILVVLQYSCPATSQEVEDESEFNYSQQSERGPARWGEIHPEWRACSNGTMQSPIDISNERVHIVSHLGKLKRSYKPANATLRNRGHDMMLSWEGKEAGAIEIDGTEYALRQCHWHSPSEHTINGRRFDLEAHLVHQTADGKIAVVGLLYKIGRPDPFLASLEDDLAAITDTTQGERDVGVMDPKGIKFGSRKYYRYIGSLTVPPCTENVVWSFVTKVRTVTREQVRLLRVAVHDNYDTNARPVQSLNHRSIQLFKPDDEEKN
ncbi:hypothetical protein V6N12_013239 [Hibiscus sabdariffa]|uniref:Carbonic anhydrase n=1 Tax=Hibiscus sabdariffa TaxID=183260 RepID=A0ABR2D8Q9_9ROSI